MEKALLTAKERAGGLIPALTITPRCSETEGLLSLVLQQRVAEVLSAGAGVDICFTEQANN